MAAQTAENKAKLTGEQPAAPESLPPAPPDDAAGPVTLGGGLGAFEPYFKQSLAEAKTLADTRAAALAALRRTQATHEQMRLGERLRHYFTSERDLWAVRGNQVLYRLSRKIVPKIQDREAIGLYREFAHRRDELAQFLRAANLPKGTKRAAPEDQVHQSIYDAQYQMDNAPGGETSAAHVRAQREFEQSLERFRLFRPVMEKALDWIDHGLPLRMADANKIYTQIATESLKEGQEGGWLDSRWTNDEYVPHLFHKMHEGELPRPPRHEMRLQGEVNKFFGFGLKRPEEQPTMLHVLASGRIPKTMDPNIAFQIHVDNFATARASHLLEEELGSAGDENGNRIGVWADDRRAPTGWVPLMPQVREFTKAFSELTEGEQQRLAEEYPEKTGKREPTTARLYVPQFIADALSPITDPDFSPKIARGWSSYRRGQAELKRAILGFSFFHLATENKMAMIDIGPAGMWKALRIDPDSREFLTEERDFVGAGGTTAVQGSTQAAYRGMQPGSIPTRGEILRARVPGAKQALELADKVTEFTFGTVLRPLKVTSYVLHRDAWLNENPDATPEEITLAKQGIASYVNGVFGGLHWENLGVSRAQVEILRAIFLAPDWTLSNAVLAKYAADDRPALPPVRDNMFRLGKVKGLVETGKELGRQSPSLARSAANTAATAVTDVATPWSTRNLRGATTKEGMQARLARAFWTRQFAYAIAATAATSLLFAGCLHPDLLDKSIPWWSKRKLHALTNVYKGDDKDGNHVTQNMYFSGSGGDAVNVLGQVMEKGPVGVGTFLGGKFAPFTRLGAKIATGTLEHQWNASGLNATAKIGRFLFMAASEMSPWPISLRAGLATLLQRLSGDESNALPSDFPLGLVGPQAQHLPPAGEKMTPRGLRTIRTPQRDENSTWKQIVTGKQYPPKRPR